MASKVIGDQRCSVRCKDSSVTGGARADVVVRHSHVWVCAFHPGRAQENRTRALCPRGGRPDIQLGRRSRHGKVARVVRTLIQERAALTDEAAC